MRHNALGTAFVALGLGTVARPANAEAPALPAQAAPSPSDAPSDLVPPSLITTPDVPYPDGATGDALVVLMLTVGRDGASALARFRYVTLPMLAPILTIVGILTVAGYFQLFAEPYVMTQGGPLQSTVSVLYFMYEEGFKWWNLGTASAVAFMLFLLIFAVTMLQLRQMRRAGIAR